MAKVAQYNTAVALVGYLDRTIDHLIAVDFTIRFWISSSSGKQPSVAMTTRMNSKRFLIIEARDAPPAARAAATPQMRAIARITVGSHAQTRVVQRRGPPSAAARRATGKVREPVM